MFKEYIMRLTEHNKRYSKWLHDYNHYCILGELELIRYEKT